jgi:cytochrome c553
MRLLARLFVAAGFTISVVASAVLSQTDAPPGGPPPPPPPREIPGLNAPDPHPNGCVDCHVNMKEMNLDVRISTLLGKWTEGVEPRLLAAAKAAAADSTKITGRHPKTAAARGNIPGACLTCHGRDAQKAPPFARMLHLLHLTGGDPNLYLSYYQGDCTHCHKLNQQTGAWTIPSAKEPPGD